MSERTVSAEHLALSHRGTGTYPPMFADCVCVECCLATERERPKGKGGETRDPRENRGSCHAPRSRGSMGERAHAFIADSCPVCPRSHLFLSWSKRWLSRGADAFHRIKGLCDALHLQQRSRGPSAPFVFRPTSGERESIRVPRRRRQGFGDPETKQNTKKKLV